jgi:hypothetical protein
MDFGWILEEAILVTAISPGEVAVDSADGRTVRLEYVERDGRGEVLADGQWYDFGDDFPCVLGIIDAAGGLAPGKSMILEGEV